MVIIDDYGISKLGSAVVKEIDEQGRLVIPKRWRSKVLKGDKVVLRLKDGSVEITPWERPDLTAFFDRVEVDIQSDLADWHAVRTELGRRRIEVRG